MPLDPTTLPYGVFSIEAGELIADAINASAGGTPGGATTQLQYNNAGAFGGIPFATYVAVATALVLNDPNLIFEAASGPTGANTVELTPTALSLTATESGSTLQINADGDIDITSNNGEFAIAAQTGAFSSSGALQFISTAGRVFFQSQLATPHYNFAGVPVFANNAAAISGGLQVGDLYRTGANPDPVCVVH